MRSGVLFNIQAYSVQDGPGIRSTFFLKGCPLRCAWCHNPEGISPRPELVLVETRCISCGECRRVCPREESRAGEGALPARAESCTLCGQCVEACPTGARTRLGEPLSPGDVLERCLRDRFLYEESGGGVTFSGGEPLLQHEFLCEALRACQAEHVHTAVDTCGFAPTNILMEVAKHTDLFLYDLKFMSDGKHRDYTGVSNELILHNLKALGRVHPRIWVRVPVIPGINDDAFELEQMADFVSHIAGVRQVNLLPYHRIGLHKWERLGQVNTLAALPPITEETIKSAMNVFEAAGLAAKDGG